VLRRSDSSQIQNKIIQFGSLRIDSEKFKVSLNDKEITLTPTEFQLLLTLTKNPGRVFTREQILCEIQGDTYDSLEKTINVHIRNLRVKIEEDPGNPKYIQTVFGVGYRFTTNT